MATHTVGDFKLASLAAGFSIGFGILTLCTAISQTMRVKSPLRSAYVYMVWGELIANLGLGIVGWLFLEGDIPTGIPVFFVILFFWVFEIHFLLQIMINRIYVVADNRRLVMRVKWLTAIFITMINIAVFCIFIPAHLDPPVSQTYVTVNHYWDRISKVLICLVDAALNFWFIYIVRQRLVRHHGLAKYAPIIVLIGLMSLKNQLVFIQFHPVTYLVKLNIELQMAHLLAKVARKEVVRAVPGAGPHSHSTNIQLSSSRRQLSHLTKGGVGATRSSDIHCPTTVEAVAKFENRDEDDDVTYLDMLGRDGFGNIHLKTDIQVQSEERVVGASGRDNHDAEVYGRPISRQLSGSDRTLANTSEEDTEPLRNNSPKQVL
ncbi:hypothetical protein FQN55_007658 [Onygenales sp. PD_40]|nr:hypothetical protein FQN55_007658 [Onygenales sp. PD_40]